MLQGHLEAHVLECRNTPHFLKYKNDRTRFRKSVYPGALGVPTTRGQKNAYFRNLKDTRDLSLPGLLVTIKDIIECFVNETRDWYTSLFETLRF